MNFFSYLRVELNRVFHSKTVYIISILTMICPMAGYKLNQTILEKLNENMFAETVSGNLIANPCIAGALGGAVLFALLTLLEFDRVRKYQTVALTDSIVSPMVLNVVKLISIGIAAIVSVILTAVLYFSYTAMKIGNTFDVYIYLNSFFLFMLPSVLLAILAASAFYQIFFRVDLSMIAFIIFSLFSLSPFISYNNILRWLNPPIPSLSDDFSNDMVFRLMKHNRIFWFLILGGLWTITLLCVRRYGKGFFGSISYNFRKVYIPILAIILIGIGCYAYINQPYIDQTPLPVKMKIGEIPNNKQLKLLNTDLEISFDTNKGSLLGKAIYSLQNVSGDIQKCTLIINSGYTVHNIIANGKEVVFKNLNNKSNIEFTVPNDEKIKLTVKYSGVPKIHKMFSDILFSTNISDKYIDLSNRELSPILKVEDSKDGTKITGRFTMPAHLVPIVIGDTVKLISKDGNNKTWLGHNVGNSFNLIAGDYVMKKLDSRGVQIEFYYNRKYEDAMKDMSSEKMIKDTIDYCNTKYGKLYNVSGNFPLKILQGTVFYFGGRAYTNFSIMEETVFSDSNLNNKLNGASNAEVLAHEIAHQWMSWKYIQDKTNKAWTSEGLTVYTTYRIAKEKYGEEYAKKNYVDKWKEGVKNKNSNFYNRHPEYLDILPNKYVAHIKGINDSTDKYQEIPLKIFKAAELVGGEANMDKILAKLYEDIPKTKVITWQNFLDACGLREEELNIE
ncbi:M1 family aminopeptidase [Clostridium lundense]|uniref:M1 family aminopeptidase n=1 Tax=Clostridium lundense TaxID=319475 RepID=UPI0004836E8E|nr:M1 family aminopeptidase [Clostridium lundense]